jgi:hypothetical protein
MFLTRWSTVFTFGCHDIVNRLGSHYVQTHTLNVRSLSEPNWPDGGSIGTEKYCLLYFNKLYVSVVFQRSILLIVMRLKLRHCLFLS